MNTNLVAKSILEKESQDISHNPLSSNIFILRSSQNNEPNASLLSFQVCVPSLLLMLLEAFGTQSNVFIVPALPILSYFMLVRCTFRWMDIQHIPPI